MERILSTEAPGRVGETVTVAGPDDVEIMDYHGFFLHGTESGRLDVER